MDVSPTLFALDIGTRSVVGLLLQKQGDQHTLIDIEIMEHQERSMLDGQIHNIPAVATVIQTVKERLEERHGPLKKACVAAAGRSLLTKRATYSVQLDEHPLHTKEELTQLELSAVTQAQYQLALESDHASAACYDCVGYSVLEYRLDGTPIGSLLQQAGKQAEIEVIATFLPKVVVESLLQALHEVSLSLEALTLEPIAAIDVLIPTSMRRLNVALVDIGAGTSDIALTADGTVQAYGMVPTAGDEITEALSDEYLLDFPEAESIKRMSLQTERVQLTDILGLTTEYTTTELFESIKPAIQELAHKIADEILRLNGKSPRAVMLVGGGSQTPFLPELIANALQLPADRVAVRGVDAIKQFVSTDEKAVGPELVTPVGIAIAAKRNPIQYVQVQVNQMNLRLFDAKKLTVGDALVSAGIDVLKHHGKPGLAMVIKVDGSLFSIPGKHGLPPVLKRNGENASLSDSIKEGDIIVIQKGADGSPPHVTVGEVVEESSQLTCYVNGERTEFEYTLLRNGQRSSRSAILLDRDEVSIQNKVTVRDVLAHININQGSFKNVQVTVNEQSLFVTHRDSSLLLNHRPASLDQKLSDGDHLYYSVPDKDDSDVTVADLIHQLGNVEQSITVTFNDETIQLTKKTVELYQGDRSVSADMLLTSMDHFVTKEVDISPFIVQDLFAVTDITIPTSNHTFTLLRNNEPVEFTTSLQHGDNIELRFEKITS
ncbi:cell division protein FtsA [Alkalicoccobacillus gibsonii]|uniref:cell division protein FtsA n=1 Tax=Alkalicoccobacillus gibsonii TaxID=79881 RepID=UPI0035151443